MLYVLQCVAVCCSVLQCVAACYSALQCVAVCSVSGVVVGAARRDMFHLIVCERGMCCSVLQCVAVCCSVLQCVAVCRSVSCRSVHTA